MPREAEDSPQTWSLELPQASVTVARNVEFLENLEGRALSCEAPARHCRMTGQKVLLIKMPTLTA